MHVVLEHSGPACIPKSPSLQTVQQTLREFQKSNGSRSNGNCFRSSGRASKSTIIYGVLGHLTELHRMPHKGKHLIAIVIANETFLQAAGAILRTTQPFYQALLHFIRGLFGLFNLYQYQNKLILVPYKPAPLAAE